VAEESGKGIALVILGIVAIIAIVGLVLLFTGARKAAVGEFAVPAAREYGGAIRGVYDPYSRAFSGRSIAYPSGRDYPSGAVEPLSGQWPGSAGTMVGGQSIGGTNDPRSVQYQERVTANRGDVAWPASEECEALSLYTTGSRRFGTATSQQEAAAFKSVGRECIDTNTATGINPSVLMNQQGLSQYGVSTIMKNLDVMADGAYQCCENAGLTGLA